MKILSASKALALVFLSYTTGLFAQNDLPGQGQKLEVSTDLGPVKYRLVSAERLDSNRIILKILIANPAGGSAAVQLRGTGPDQTIMQADPETGEESVLEVLPSALELKDAVLRIVGVPQPLKFLPRRPGDRYVGESAIAIQLRPDEGVALGGIFECPRSTTQDFQLLSLELPRATTVLEPIPVWNFQGINSLDPSGRVKSASEIRQALE